MTNQSCVEPGAEVWRMVKMVQKDRGSRIRRVDSVKSARWAHAPHKHPVHFPKEAGGGRWTLGLEMPQPVNTTNP